MSFYRDIRMNAKDASTQQEAPALAPDELNPQELASLLEILKRATFMGEQVEIVYNMVLKLQNQYTKQTVKK